MNLPSWVAAEIYKFIAPKTGRVEIALEIYNNQVTRLSLGNIIRLKPKDCEEPLNGERKYGTAEERANKINEDM